MFGFLSQTWAILDLFWMIFFSEFIESHPRSNGVIWGQTKFSKILKIFKFFKIFFLKKTNKKLFFLDKKSKNANFELKITNILQTKSRTFYGS